MRKIVACLFLCGLLLGCKGSEQKSSSVQQSPADDSETDSADTEVRFSPPRSIAKIEANEFKGDPFGFGAADFDKDGFMDFIMVQEWCHWNGFSCDGYSGTVVLYRNNGRGDFENPQKITDIVIPRECVYLRPYTAEDVMKMTAVDFDGDGDQDLVANCFGDILLYENVAVRMGAETTEKSKGGHK